MGRDEDDVRVSEYWVNGALIVGAGPGGLAVAACLWEQGVPCVVLERSDCIASLWEKRTYDRLKLHLPKRFCQLPLLPFPPSFPEYPSRAQFLSYLRSYARRFDIAPQFGANVASARRDEPCGVWRVRANVAGRGEVEYVCQWLVVATGENAELVLPEVEGLSGFRAGPVMHAADYKSGEAFRGKRVLVVGCGNSGMEVCLDLCHHGASPTMVVRDSVHVLPREVLGKSTFGMSVAMMRWLPVWLVDKFMLAMARLTLGDVERYGLRRLAVGPLELKSREGKTPVLDIGALAKIKSGEIKVVPEVRMFLPGSAQLVDGRIIEADAVVLATGYRSNVTSWLKGTEFFTSEGFPRDGWKGKCGLYAVGFARRGLSGISQDAVRIAEHLGKVWREETKQAKHITASCHNRCS